MIRDLVLFITATLFLIGLMYFIIPNHSERMYNCSIAEISPDYPLAVKEACRKQRLEKK